MTNVTVVPSDHDWMRDHDWVVDPDAVTFLAYEQADGVYRRAVKAAGAERATLARPFDITICPADLIAGR